METISNSEFYNLLLDVEPADEHLSLMDKDQILRELCALIAEYNLADIVGIRLLHRHNDLRKEEIMLETEECLNDGVHYLTTSARSLNEISGAYRPNNWQLKNDKFIQLEYSNDISIAQDIDVLSAYADFFKQFGAILSGHNVSGFLGPCLLNRDFYNRHRPSVPSLLVETSDPVRRANLVAFAVGDTYNWDNMIQTVWRVSADTSSSLVCVPVSGCIRVGGGAHTPMTGHNDDTI